MRPSADRRPMRRFLTRRQLGLRRRLPATRIMRLETWRFGVESVPAPATRTHPRAATKAIRAVFARDEDAHLIGGVFGESVPSAAAGSVGCTFGSDTGVTRRLARRLCRSTRPSSPDAISCEGDIGRLLALHERRTGAPVALDQDLRHARDGHRPDRTEPQGRRRRCMNPGWRKASDAVTYDASDSSGIRAVRLDLGRSRRTRQGGLRLPPDRSLRGAAQRRRSAVPDRHGRRHLLRAHRGRGRVGQRAGRRSARSASTARRRPPSSSAHAARRSCSR